MLLTVISIPALFLGVVAGLFYFYMKRKYTFWKKLGVLGPEPTLFFGNLKSSALKKKYIPTEIQEIYNEYPNEKFVGMYNFTVPALLIRDLDIIRNIFIKDFDRFQDRGFALDNEGLGANLFHTDGDRWPVLRRKFSPIFTAGKLKNMFNLITDRADAFIKFVDKNVDEGKEPEIGALTAKYTLEVIGACAFGLNVNSLNDEPNKYQEMNNKIFEPSVKRLIDLMMPGVFRKFGVSFFPPEVVHFFKHLTKQMVSDREGKPKIRQDFMDLLVEMKEQGFAKGTKGNGADVLDLEVTESLIAAQTFVFFAAGYETSATTMAFTLYELARNPVIQDRVIEEIDRVLDANDGKLTYDVLKEFTYMPMVISETLRVYPVVDPLNRVALVDYKIPDTDFTIPKGTPIIISVGGIHHDAKYWTNPEKFDPERFLPENVKNRHPMAWAAFGDGPRHCIGMRFAKVQSTVGLVSLLRKFRVSTCARTAREPAFSPGRLTPQLEGGMWLKITRR